MTRRTQSQYDWDKVLFDETIIPNNGNNYNTGRSAKIEFITVHHMMIQDRDLSRPDALDACWRTWVTEGREASAHYGVEDHFVRQFMDAVKSLGDDRLEADRVNLFHRLEDASLRIRQVTEKQVDSFGVAGHAQPGQVLFGPVPVVAIGKDRAVAAADPFNFGFDQDVGIGHIEQFVLQRSAADVTDEN